MSEYPSRPACFAFKVIRTMTKTAAANEITPGGAWLVAIVAMQEDAKRYTAAPTYWNDNLMSLCGFGGRSRLVAARSKAIEAAERMVMGKSRQPQTADGARP